MATALAVQMHAKYPQVTFHTFTPTFTKAQQLAQKVEGNAWKNLKDIPPSTSIYLIACKPQQFDDLAKNLIDVLPNDATVVSIMAGVKVDSICRKLKTKRVIRVMPNTPAQIGLGVAAIYFNNAITSNLKQKVSSLFAATSSVFTFDKEEQIDVITPFSGSGPAYIFEVARILIDKLTTLNVPPAQAQAMIKKTFLGASKLMDMSDQSPVVLRDQVTSKKGVTAQALEMLEKNNLEKIFGEALDEAYKRSKELNQ